MAKFVCFGEIMARLNPVGNLRLVQAEMLEISYAGGEANVAVSLANYGKDAGFVTKLPANDLAKAATRKLRSYGVDVNDIVTGGERMGVYFVEKGASQRASKVLYDRKNSAIADAEMADFDWDKIFADTQWFHFTGITPALSDKAAAICLEACKKAKEKGIDAETAVFPLSANGKAISYGEDGGMMKLVYDKADGTLIGASFCGIHVTEMIWGIVGYLGLEMTVEEMAKVVHPHPTVSEAIMEAAHAANGMPIHI